MCDDHPFMKLNLMPCLSLSLLLLAPSALAHNHWRVRGQILETLNPAAGTTAPLTGVEVRVSARWSDSSLCPQIGLGDTQPCPWNSVNWSRDTTDSAGRFTSDSILYLDPVAAYDRDFKVEVRTWMNPSWIMIGTVQSRSGPSNLAGPHIPPAVHTVTLNPIVVDLYPEPPIDLTPEENGEETTGNDDASPPTPHIGEADPCLPPYGSNFPRPDLVFGPLTNAAGPNVTPDGLVRIEMRTVAGAPHARRLTFTMVVRNQTSGPYPANEPCVALIRVFRNEGPGFYAATSVGAVLPADQPLEAIAGNGFREVQMNVTIRGTGNDGPGAAWEEGYEHVRFEIALDADHRIYESDEGNNTIGPYCYHAPSNTVVALGVCGVPDSDSSKAKDPGGKGKPGSVKRRDDGKPLQKKGN